MNLASLTQIPLELQRALVTGEVLGESEFLALVADVSPTREGAQLIAAAVSRLQSDKSALILLLEVKTGAHTEGTVALRMRVGYFPLEEMTGAWGRYEMD